MKISTLYIEMAANVARLRQDMESAQKTVDKAMGGITKAARGAMTALGALGVGVSVAGLATLVRNFAKAGDEIQRFSTLANTATADFQKMAYGSQRFGVSQEKLADILKDVQDKVGDFMQTGGGAMADFFENIAPKVGVTADQFRRLGGADALQLYVSSLEKANLSQSDMTFYLEAIASDSALLLPLLKNNGKAMGELGEEASRLGVILDNETIAAARELNVQLDIVIAQLRGMGTTVAREVLPVLVELAKQMNEVSDEGSTMDSVSDGIATALETIAVLGLNTSFVLKQIYLDVQGLGKISNEFFTGNFSGAIDAAKEIGERWATAGAQVDAASKRILNARKVAAAGELDEPWVKRMKAGAQGSAGESILSSRIDKDAATRAKKSIDERAKLEKEHSEWLKSMAADEDAYRQKLFKERLEIQEQGEKEHSDWLKAMEDDAVKYRLALHEKRLDAQEKAAKDAAEEMEKLAEKEQDAYLDMWRSIDETAKDVFTDVANEGEDAFERIGKTLKAAILDMLYQMTVRKWIFQIAGVDVGGMGGMGGGSSNLAGSAVRYAGSGASSWVGNTIGGGNTGALVGGATGTMGYANVMGSLYANAATAGMATSGIAASGAGIDALLATNAAYGTATASAAGTAAASGAATGAASGVSAGLAAVPVWGWIALAVLALWEPMFGRKVKEIGQAGNFDGAGGISTSQYTHKQGGWFRSDKTYYDPLNDGGAFQRQLKGVQDGMIETARVMGLGEEAIRNFSGSININLKGLNAQEAAAKTKEEMTKLQAQMLATASFVPQVVQGFEQIEAAALEMGMSAEEAARHAREVTARDDGLKRQGFEQMTNYYIGLINQTEEVMARAGLTSQAMADVITAGMTGRLNQSQVGAQLADIVLGGIYNTIAGGFAQQISDVFMQQIIQPIMLAVTAGVPLTTAISQQAMSAVVAQAQQSAAILSAIFADPVFKQTMSQLQTVISGISIASVKPAKHIKAFGTAALGAGTSSFKAADQVQEAWKQITNTIIDEIRRIRGEVLGSGPDGVANLQAQFAVMTARARAGSQDAAEQLPGLSRDLIELARETAGTLSDFRAIQGSTLASLEATARYLAKRYKFTLPSFDVGTNEVPQDMLAMVHKGEAIVPAKYNNSNADARDDELRAIKGVLVTVSATLNRMEEGNKKLTNGYSQIRTKEVTA